MESAETHRCDRHKPTFDPGMVESADTGPAGMEGQYVQRPACYLTQIPADPAAGPALLSELAHHSLFMDSQVIQTSDKTTK